jgi:predicted thioesterase
MKNARNISLSISSNYGFDHNWTLHLDNKSFYLGQDVKFCSRVLGLQPKQVVNQIGTNDLQSEIGTTKLAKFIVKQLGLTKTKVKNLQPWELCAQ